MSVQARFELNITTNTQDEMDKIAEAVFSGFAEHVIKERVLWGMYAAPTAPAPVASSEPTPELKRVATKVKGEPKPVAQVKQERPVGVLGRGRLGRS